MNKLTVTEYNTLTEEDKAAIWARIVAYRAANAGKRVVLVLRDDTNKGKTE